MGIYTSLNPSTKRKAGENISYELPNLTTGKQAKTNIYIQTLIANSNIEGSGEKKLIQ